MHTAHSRSWLLGGVSASVHAGIHPQALGLDIPSGVGLETPPARSLNFPLGCWPEDPPPGQTPQPPPTLGVSLETPPPVDRFLDIRFSKYYLAQTSLRVVINTRLTQW